jgi:hypothetical protein
MQRQVNPTTAGLQASMCVFVYLIVAVSSVFFFKKKYIFYFLKFIFERVKIIQNIKKNLFKAKKNLKSKSFCNKYILKRF